MPRKKRKVAEVVTSGVCFKCGGPARGGRYVRRGTENEKLCPTCLRKSDRDLVLTHDEAALLMNAARELGPRHALFVALGLNLGTRVSETVMMKGSDFDWQEKKVWVTTLKQKRHPKRVVHLSGALVRMLRRLIGDRQGYLFPRLRGGHRFKKGGHVSRWTGNQLFRAAAAAAGLRPEISAHAMRHYCAVKTLESTGELFFTSRQLRHSSLKTTERYLHLLPARAAELAAKVPVTWGD